jgi:putative oxidoreductase
MMAEGAVTRNTTILSWACQLIAAAILGQTLFFKFTGAEESVYIFSTLGMEPWGRIGTGALELVAALMLLHPRTAAIGAVLAAGLMGGAIVAHLSKLGIEIMGDGGLLFGLAVTVLLAAATVIVLRRREIPVLGDHL